jgi:hypothetical protein
MAFAALCASVSSGQGIALAIARETPPVVIRGNVLEVLEGVLSRIPENLNVCVFNSATLFYLSDDDCAKFVSLLDRLATPRLHWLSLEGGAPQTFGAKLPFDGLYEPRPQDRPTDIFGLIGYSSWKTAKREDRLLGLRVGYRLRGYRSARVEAAIHRCH